MAPKKEAAAEPKPLLGRVGTNLKVGIVGVPNVGKSTFFNVLTKSQAAAENFPFCTIDPNENKVPVPDARFDFLCEYFKPVSSLGGMFSCTLFGSLMTFSQLFMEQSLVRDVIASSSAECKVPAFLNVVDIAGLVQGASEGQGLGNAFLSHIRACDAIFHLCRCFEDDDVTHIEGDINPIRDIGIINEELRLKDVEYLNGVIDKLERTVLRGGDKKMKPEYDILCKFRHMLMEEKKHIRFGDWNANEIEILNKHLFITSKPMMYLVNLSEKDYIRKKNKWLVKLKEWVDANDPGAMIIPFSGILETKLVDMSPEDKLAFLDENKTQSSLDKIIVQGYKALQLQYFFTSGPDEVKAWTIQKGTKAPQAAGRIHTDFEKGFIMAEVMKYEDFKEEGSEAAVKAAGKYRQQGRNYVVEDGDIILFKFNAGAGLKSEKKK